MSSQKILGRLLSACNQRLGLIAGVSGMGAVASMGGAVALANDDAMHPGQYPWDHSGPMSAFDKASVRRGFQVYREVCASCHSLDRIAFRNLVGVSHTQEQAKAISATYDVVDGPNDQGEMFERPGKLSDYLPNPYANEEAARAANNGAYPPDLSLMVKARHDGANYIFSLLTGYKETPAGVQLLEGMHWNPYFPGGAIGMPPPVMDECVEYADGTPATASQVAKDVTTFLNWTAEPEHDDRKLMGCKFLAAMLTTVALTAYYKRWRWGPIKTRHISYKDNANHHA